MVDSVSWSRDIPICVPHVSAWLAVVFVALMVHLSATGRAVQRVANQDGYRVAVMAGLLRGSHDDLSMSLCVKSLLRSAITADSASSSDS